MDEHDEDFWSTYIPATPDEDRDFAGCGPLASVILIALIAVVVIGFVVRF